MRRMMLLWLVGLALAAGSCRTSRVVQHDGRGRAAQTTGPLYNDIFRADSSMFAAFNSHDLTELERWFAPDLEFYHDKGGLLSHEQVMEGFRSNFAKNNGLRRDLVGRIEVYPIPGYGAIEVGSHRFCHVEDGRNDCGVFQFLHVWHNKGGRWQVTRAVSYDHK